MIIILVIFDARLGIEQVVSGQEFKELPGQLYFPVTHSTGQMSSPGMRHSKYPRSDSTLCPV